MPNNGLLNIDGKVIDSTPPSEIADIVDDAVAEAVADLDSTLVHKAGDGTTPKEITGIKGATKAIATYTFKKVNEKK